MAAMLAVWRQTGDTPLVVYALSFWHYCVYIFAFAYRSASLEQFRRDAILLRTVALGALGWVYFSFPINVLSLSVSGAGFLLNAAAVHALGTERTYYGVELAGLPYQPTHVFPYSVMSHPMLIGNMVAFTGLLLHPEFRGDWWPLPLVHVVFNGLVIFVEAMAAPVAAPEPPSAFLLGVRIVGAGLAAAGVSAGIAVLIGRAGVAPTAFVGGAMAAYLTALWEAYSRRSNPRTPVPTTAPTSGERHVAGSRRF
jgi:hypothetical protein